jgi:hypothetical protein
VRLYAESIRAADGTGSNRVGGNYNGFREHYKWVPHWCAEFDADNFDRVTAKVQDGSRHRYQAECKYDRPFQEGDGTPVADLPTYKAGDAADLKVSSSKLAGRRWSNSLKLVNWVWELETLPTAWSQGVIVNLKLEHSCQELQGDHPGINLPQDVSACCASA